MTVDTTLSSVRYTGNGVATVFPTTFKLNTSEEVIVTIVNDLTGTTNVLTPADYTIESFSQPQFTDIVYPITGSPLNANQSIFIERSTDLLQKVKVANQTRYNAGVVSRVWDKIHFILQELTARLGNALSVDPALGYNATISPITPGQFVWLKPDGSGFAGADPDFSVTLTDAENVFSLRNFENAFFASTLSDGITVFLANHAYLRDDAAVGVGSVTSDLGVSGFVPHGKVFIGHFGGNLANAVVWCTTTGKTLHIDVEVFVPSNTTLTCPVHVEGGSFLIENAVTLTISDTFVCARQKVFDRSLGGDFNFTVGDEVYPEWLSEGDTDIEQIFKRSAPGAQTKLLPITYDLTPLLHENDPNSVDGGDTAKMIVGTVEPQRYLAGGTDFWGTRLRLVDGANDDAYRIDTIGPNSWGGGGLKDLMIDGNRGNNTTGDGIRVLAIRDFYLENVQVFNCAGDGINFEGANNQVHVQGRLESWNNNRDGIRAGALGDFQIGGAIRCVNNGRHGFYLAAGGGRLDQIYTYFNTGYGVWIADTVTKNLFVQYLRSEDNGLEGARIDAPGFHCVDMEVPDNGTETAVNLNRTGVYLGPNAKRFRIGKIGASVRTAAVHNQQQIVYQAMGAMGIIEEINNDAYGKHGIVDERGAVFSQNFHDDSIEIGRRLTNVDTLANLLTSPGEILMEPAVYQTYVVQNATASFTFPPTVNNQSTNGNILRVEVQADAVITVSFDTLYRKLSQRTQVVEGEIVYFVDYVALGDISLSPGQQLNVKLRRENRYWIAAEHEVIR